MIFFWQSLALLNCLGGKSLGVFLENPRIQVAIVSKSKNEMVEIRGEMFYEVDEGNVIDDSKASGGEVIFFVWLLEDGYPFNSLQDL